MMRGTLYLGLLLCFLLAVGAVTLPCIENKCAGSNNDCGGEAAGKCETETQEGCSVQVCVCVSGYVGGMFKTCISGEALVLADAQLTLETAANVQRRSQEEAEATACTSLLVPPLRPASPAELPHGTPTRRAPRRGSAPCD